VDKGKQGVAKMLKCSGCGCDLTEDNNSYADYLCDECYEDEQDDVEDEEDENI